MRLRLHERPRHRRPATPSNRASPGDLEPICAWALPPALFNFTEPRKHGNTEARFTDHQNTLSPIFKLLLFAHFPPWTTDVQPPLLRFSSRKLMKEHSTHSQKHPVSEDISEFQNVSVSAFSNGDAPTANHAAYASSAFWIALESVPGGHALPTIWQQHLQQDFGTFKILFLRSRPDIPSASVPCPWSCGCSHKVLPRDNGTLAGICQCNPQKCGEYTVLPEEMIPWELDWSKIPRVLCRAFDLQPKIVKLGLYNTLQIGFWGRDEIPAILTLASNPVEFLNIVAVLVTRFARPIILFAPTNRNIGASAKELLGNIGAAFFSLDAHLILEQKHHAASGEDKRPNDPDFSISEFQLSAFPPPSTLFSEIAPLLPDPSDEDLARRVCIVMDTLDSESRRKKPSLLTIFRLYCVQEMTVAQIAHKCNCSKATVSNRLSLLQSKTGVPHAKLRRVSAYFTRFQQDMASARDDYSKHKNQFR
jgi:hypothetical protein